MFADRFHPAADGTRLHYRDYPGAADRPPVLCLHGLTRNPRDFEGVAARLNAAGWRVIVPSIRGRGDSAWADAKTYALPVYLKDIDALAEHAGFARAAHIGTSMGALLTMLIAAARPGRVVAACLNDIGPVIEADGLRAIAAYLGDTHAFPTWDAAADALALHGARSFPDYTHEDWLIHARRRARETAPGRIELDYDPALARTFSADPGDGAAALWPMFDALRDVPTLSVRGALSDLFSAATQAAMAARHAAMATATVPRAGHAPSLEEPEAAAALDALLARVSEGSARLLAHERGRTGQTAPGSLPR